MSLPLFTGILRRPIRRLNQNRVFTGKLFSGRPLLIKIFRRSYHPRLLNNFPGGTENRKGVGRSVTPHTSLLIRFHRRNFRNLMEFKAVGISETMVRPLNGILPRHLVTSTITGLLGTLPRILTGRIITPFPANRARSNRLQKRSPFPPRLMSNQSGFTLNRITKNPGGRRGLQLQSTILLGTGPRKVFGRERRGH